MLHVQEHSSLTFVSLPSLHKLGIDQCSFLTYCYLLLDACQDVSKKQLGFHPLDTAVSLQSTEHRPVLSQYVKRTGGLHISMNCSNNRIFRLIALQLWKSTGFVIL